MAKNDNRIKVKMRSTAGTGFTYMTTKNKSTQRERLTMKKYDPVLRQHVDFREEK